MSPVPTHLMASIQNDLRLFGIDLRHLGRELSSAMQGLLQSPILSWLSQRPAVCLRHCDNQGSVWLGASPPRFAPKLQPKVCRFDAIELPQELLLQRDLRLPSLPESQLRSAIALVVQAASPFAAGDVVWGYRASPRDGGSTEVCLLMASRKQVLVHLSSTALMGRPAALRSDFQPEVWALTDRARQAVVLEGFGEQRRFRAVAVRRNMGLGLLLIALALLAAIAVTPSAQLRFKALDGANQHGLLTLKTAALVKERENLIQSAEQLKGLSQDLSLSVSPLRVLEALTQILPDDTAVLSFKLKGDKVTLVGVTPNASSLMQLLGAQTGFRDVRAPSAAVRSSGSNKESFSIEFFLDPHTYGVYAGAAGPAAAASAPPPESTPTARADLPVPVSPPAAPSNAPPRTPSFGGGPVFGGATVRPATKSGAASESANGSAKANKP